jgi:hypothetical protein
MARDHQTATLLQNGQVRAAGGETESNDGNSSIIASTELYSRGAMDPWEGHPQTIGGEGGPRLEFL